MKFSGTKGLIKFVTFSYKRNLKRETHATYDNDFRRAHPSGLTIGEYLRKELADKVGGADVFVGLPDSGKQPALMI